MSACRRAVDVPSTTRRRSWYSSTRNHRKSASKPRIWPAKLRTTTAAPENCTSASSLTAGRSDIDQRLGAGDARQKNRSGHERPKGSEAGRGHKMLLKTSGSDVQRTRGQASAVPRRPEGYTHDHAVVRAVRVVRGATAPGQVSDRTGRSKASSPPLRAPQRSPMELSCKSAAGCVPLGTEI